MCDSVSTFRNLTFPVSFQSQRSSLDFRSPYEHLLRPSRIATEPKTTDWALEAAKAQYPARSNRSPEDSILDIIKNGYQPPVTLRSKLTFADMDPLNTPVCLGSKTTFKSLGFGKST